MQRVSPCALSEPHALDGKAMAKVHPPCAPQTRGFAEVRQSVCQECCARGQHFYASAQCASRDEPNTGLPGDRVAERRVANPHKIQIGSMQCEVAKQISRIVCKSTTEPRPGNDLSGVPRCDERDSIANRA